MSWMSGRLLPDEPPQHVPSRPLRCSAGSACSAWAFLSWSGFGMYSHGTVRRPPCRATGSRATGGSAPARRTRWEDKIHHSQNTSVRVLVQVIARFISSETHIHRLLKKGNPCQAAGWNSVSKSILPITCLQCLQMYLYSVVIVLVLKKIIWVLL